MNPPYGLKFPVKTNGFMARPNRTGKEVIKSIAIPLNLYKPH